MGMSVGEQLAVVIKLVCEYPLPSPHVVCSTVTVLCNVAGRRAGATSHGIWPLIVRSEI